MSSGRLADGNALLETGDVLVAPTTPTPAWPFDATEVTLNGVTEPYRATGLRLTVPFTALGGPSLSVPCGFSADGLPHSIQFTGRRLGEAMLCRVAYAYERATDWHNRHPRAPA